MLGGFSERQQCLLELLLRHQGGMTMEALASSLKVSKSAVHQHLNTLERDGYVIRKALRKTGGRPSQLYALTERGIHLFPKQYAWFSRLLLEQLLERLGSEEVEQLLYQQGRATAAGLLHRLAGKSGRGRLEEVVAIMQEFGYEAELREGAQGPEIVAHNCIYHDLAKEHSEVCTLDMGFLDGLLDRVFQQECIVQGGSACRFCPLAVKGDDKGNGN